MTLKSITGEDLLKYIARRKQILKIQWKKSLRQTLPSEREKVRRMFIGRIRELDKLAELIHNSAIDSASKEYSRRIYEETQEVA